MYTLTCTHGDRLAQVFALIRPRSGDFLYSRGEGKGEGEEVDVMVEDIAQLRKAGVHGFVIGALTARGDVDVAVTRRLVAACGQCEISFHRAFDMARDMRAALETIGREFAGSITRVLTSGGKASALEGAHAIQQLQPRARRLGITLVAGGGVSEDNVARIVAETGVTEVHGSARASVPSGMQHRNGNVHMGAAVHPVAEFSTKQASSTRVASIKQGFVLTSLGQASSAPPPS